MLDAVRPFVRKGGTELDAAAARTWIALAVGVLVVAGLFALILVVGRMPPLDRLFTDPTFFRRGLVVHVDLALVAWFYCFLTGLWFLLPTRGDGPRLCHRSHWIAIAGLALMIAGAAAPTAVPVLSNYVPVLDHPVFMIGLGVFFAGVVFAMADRRLSPSNEAPPGRVPLPDAARPGLRAAAVVFGVAMLTFAITFANTPAHLNAETYYELGFWGGGHVLQIASELGMLVVWLMLVEAAVGRPVLSRRTSTVLFGLLALPALAGPALALLGPTDPLHRVGFTFLMRWGIFPVVTVFFVLCVRAIAQARRDGRLPARGFSDPRLLGFIVSAALTALGFALGAMIRGSNTMVPAHYHASIGAVTAAYMAGTWLVFEPLGLRLRGARRRAAAAWQPALFGVGQIVFAAGFGWAGAHGAARKAYGAEQTARDAMETLGLGVMGVGGLVAAAGGVLFLALVLDAFRGANHPSARTPWKTPSPLPTRSSG